MKIKLVSLLALSLAISSLAISQKQTGGVILRGGVNLANISINNDGGVDDNKSLTSFQVGAIADLPLTNFLSVQPGLLFTGKGSKTQSGNTTDNNYFRATTNPYYLEIPVNLVFKTPTGSTRFFAGAGPYVGIGIAGKNKVEGKLLGNAFSSEDKIEWSNDDPTTSQEEGGGYGIMRRFDYGLNGTVGIEAGSMVISANYGLGLAKIQSNTNSSSNDNNKHRVFSLTLGFRL